MNKKIFLSVIGAFLVFFAGTTSTQAGVNLALSGTAGNDGMDPGWVGATGDMTHRLNDGVLGVPGWIVFDSGVPARGWITWEEAIAVQQVKVYHGITAGLGYITEAFQIQTLVEGGNAASDADWITQASVTGNTNAVTTHDFPPVVTRGVRILMTGTGSAGSAPPIIEEMQVYGSSLTNVGSVGTPANDGMDAGWVGATGDMTHRLNDGVLGVPGWIVFDSGLPARGWITWEEAVLVQQVKVYHAITAGSVYITKAFQIQTLVDAGNPANDGDWITQVSVTDNTNAVTTHDFPPVVTRGVRIFMTDNSADPIIEEMEVSGYMSEPLYVFSLMGKIDDLKAKLASANANIADLQNQLATAQADMGTANATILSLQSQLNTAIALAGSLQTQLNAADAMIASLTAQLNTANATITSQQATITTLQNSLNAAYTTIGLLNAEVSRLTAEYDAAIAGLYEIKRLIGTPQGKRASNGIEAGDTTVGALVNDVIDMLLAPPGQNIRNQDWKN